MSYAKSALRITSEGADWLTHRNGIYRVRNNDVRTYVVRSIEDFNALPRKACSAYKCVCGTIYSWIGSERPLCPNCKDRKEGGKLYVLRDQAVKDEQYRKKNAYTFEDGVYVDVSKRGLIMILGFAVVKNEQAELFSCRSSEQKSAQAETEAVRVARLMWPNMVVFCDYDHTCRITGATYINRDRNKLAHKAARSRINYRAKL